MKLSNNIKQNNLGLFLGCFLIFLSFALVGQDETFSKRYHFDHPNSLLFVATELSDGYVATGFMVDSLNSIPAIFAKFDFEGNVLFQKTYGGNGAEHFWSGGGLQFYDQNTLFTYGYTFNLTGGREGYLMFFDLEGDTLSTINMKSPVEFNGIYYSDFFSIFEVDKLPSGELIVGGLIASGQTGNDIIIRKIDIFGNILWEYIYQEPPLYDFAWDLFVDEYGSTSILPATSFIDDQTAFGYNWITIDSEGVEIERRLLDLGGIVPVNPHFEINHDGDLFLLASESLTDYRFEIRPKVWCFDSLGNIKWSKVIWEEDDFNRRNRPATLFLQEDGSIIASGARFTNVLPATLEDGEHNSKGWLAKLGADGDLKWARYYRLLETRQDVHRVYDVTQTSNGGFLICGETDGGEIDDPEFGVPYQRGWLIKTDEYGCVVPGCNQFDTPNIEVENYFICGPVPATSFINIYLGKAVPENTYFTITDSSGRLVYDFIPDDVGTFVLDVSNYNSGSYIVSLISPEGKLQHQKVIIARD